MLFRSGGRLAVSPAEAVRLMNSEDAIPVDIRPAKAFHAGHLLKALHTTPEDIAAGAEKLAKHRDKPLIVCCDRGLSSVASAKALRAAGNRVLYFAGYKKPSDRYKIEEIEAAADVVIWACDEGPAFTPRRPQDRAVVTNIVEAMRL